MLRMRVIRAHRLRPSSSSLPALMDGGPQKFFRNNERYLKRSVLFKSTAFSNQCPFASLGMTAALVGRRAYLGLAQSKEGNISNGETGR